MVRNYVWHCPTPCKKYTVRRKEMPDEKPHKPRRGPKLTLGRPVGSVNKNVALRPKVTAALALRASGASMDEIKEKCGYMSKRAAYASIERGRKRMVALGYVDPVKAARECVITKLIPPAIRVYDDTLNSKDKKGRIPRLIAATNVLKGTQVFVGKNESEETRKTTINEIETKRIEIAFEKKLIDKFNLDVIDGEIVENKTLEEGI
jgi:hypothetical protein